MDLSDKKKAHIRGYLLLLMEEGVFTDARGGGMGVIGAAVSAFGRDVGVVVGEMAQEFGQVGGNKLIASLGEAGGTLLADLGARALARVLKKRA